MFAPLGNAVAFPHPCSVFLIKRRFRPLRRATRWGLVCKTNAPLTPATFEKVDETFRVALVVHIFLFDHFIDKLNALPPKKQPHNLSQITHLSPQIHE